MGLNAVLESITEYVNDRVIEEVTQKLSEQPTVVKCAECNNSLDVTESEVDEYGDQYLEILPCDVCIGAAKDESSKATR